MGRGSAVRHPRNTRYVHANSRGDEPARLLVATPLPLLCSLLQDHDLIWNPGPAGGWDPGGDPYSSAGEVVSRRAEQDDVVYVDATFVADVRGFDDLRSWPDRGGSERLFPVP